MQDAMKATAAAKVDKNVVEGFEKEKFVDILIELHEQVDTSKVAQAAKQQLGLNATAYNQKMAARYAVVDALQQTAETTQAPLIKVLEKAKAEGSVKDYESFHIMNVISVQATKEVVEQLAFYPEVARIKENEFVPLVLPEVTGEPPVMVTDDGVEWNIARVQAPETWQDFGVTGEGIVVGVIDTGVQWNHPALMENFRGYNPDDPNNPDATGNWLDRIGSSTLPTDTHGHGTHVTGTVMGQAPGNIIGVAPDAEWIAARVFSAAGGSQADILAAGEYMLAPNGDPSLAPDIVQNSWGGQPGISEWFRPMVQSWRNAGMLPVFSAGNSGPGAMTVTPPANYPESYAVAATDINDAVASFSSRGPANYDGDQKPNISAPGVNIRSSVPGGGYEGGWNGTSMASPHIAGVAALLLSIDAALTPDELEVIMDESAMPLTDSQYTEVPNDGYGVGLVNAYDAVAMIADGLAYISGQVLREGSDTEPPTIEHTPVESGFSGLDIPVYATISDDVAVTSAKIIVSHDDFEDDYEIEMSRISGNHLSGEYRGVIPYILVQEPGFTYQIIATDFGGNTEETDAQFVAIQFGVVPGEYSQDFENFPLGWLMEGTWQWGEPAAGVGPEPVVGSKLIGTNLSGNYPHNATDILLLPPFDLRDADEASLRMNHWYDIENNWDNGYVGVSADYGQTWEVVGHFTGRDQQWRNLFVDLNPYVGSADPIFVAFEFTSDGSVAYPGWYLDNVELVGVDDTPPDPPTGLAAEASSVGVSLTWNASLAPDTNGYRVYRSTTSGEDFEQIAETTNTFYTDTNLDAGTEYFYHVTAFDYSNNESIPSNEVSAGAPNIEVIFHTDFDADDGGFTTGGANNSWQWGTPTSGPGEAFVGENLWATNLSGSYNNNEDSWIMSPEIDLSSDLATAELTFSYWQNIENNWDFGYVEVTTDGGATWDTLASYTNIFQFWQTDSISLNAYIGETIQFRFALDTDGSVVRVGWYIDDVYVLGGYDDTDANASSKPIERASLDTSKEKVVSKLQDYRIQKDPASYNFKPVTGGVSITSVDGLPLEATVTVLETNRTARTNPVDGSYTLRVSAGDEYTVRAEAYGYYPAEATVTVEEDETAIQNFILDPLPRGDIEGSVTNSRTGDGIANASLSLVNDPRVPGVTTDEDGGFTFENVLEGEYTVRVSAEGYNPTEVTVEVEGGEVTNLPVSLSPFIGYEDEIAYDTGNAENAVVLNAAGNGLAVKFTPDDMAEVRGVNLYIWDSSWPVPGGNEINIVVYDTDANGNPGNRVVGPVPATVDRGGWNYIDLSDYGFVTDGDFFISTLQDQIGDLSPGVGTDMDGAGVGRSYLYVNGDFQQNTQYGNFMIRANVAYSLDAPVITTPAHMTYTNEGTVEVAGTTTAESTVNIYNNGELAGSVESENREFSVTIELEEGENVITATAAIEQGETDPSAAVTVIKDTVAPDVTITSPLDGDVTNSQVVTVTGTASDENLANVSVNGESVSVDEDGAFSKQIIVEEGENTFTVEATDLAGNSTTESVTIEVDWTAPTIENITPATDIAVSPGDEVVVSFTSDSEGGEASFTVSIPSAMQTNNDGSVPMTEVSPGVYEGTWIAPDANFANAVINITMTDAAGNTATATAPGKLTVDIPSLEGLYKLVADFEAAGDISRQAANQLNSTLANAESHYDRGRMRQAISQLDQFIDRVNTSNHMRNASAEVKATLTDYAERLKEAWEAE
ncbi:MAG: S8 family serine peptidase [Bacillus sp. (in: Bacteria)]|nr:S8 family serine peptidase [Bacillus sp. (in: firmicutes)]